MVVDANAGTMERVLKALIVGMLGGFRRQRDERAFFISTSLDESRLRISFTTASVDLSSHCPGVNRGDDQKR